MDYGHKWTDEELRKLEQRISAEYKQAADEMQKKVEKYYADFARKDEIKRVQVSQGKITQSEYLTWRRNQMLVGKRWEEMQANLAQDMHTVNMKTASMTRQFSYDAYAMNFNYGVFETEKQINMDTSFTLYDRSTVERLIRDDPDMLPPPGKRVSKRIAEGKDVLWNKQIIQSVMTQSILQGESIPKIAERLAKEVGDKNKNAAIRNARTMTTGAENAGRVDSYERAEKMGIQMEQMWVATLDNRTRHEHRQLDGMKVKVGQPFVINNQQIMFPGDPHAAPYLVWNCRCTLIGVVASSNVEAYKRGMEAEGNIKGNPDMTYEEWKNQHTKGTKPVPAPIVPEKSWQDRIKELANSNNITEAEIMQAGKIMQEQIQDAKNKLTEYNETVKKAREEKEILYSQQDWSFKACDILQDEIKTSKTGNSKFMGSDIESRILHLISEKKLNVVIRENDTINDVYGKFKEYYWDSKKRYQDTNKSFFELINKRDEIKLQYMKDIKEKYAEIRPMGINNLNIKSHLQGRSPVKKIVANAYDFYPTVWVQNSINAGNLKPQSAERGYYWHDIIAISGYDELDQTRCAIHELGHRFEESQNLVIHERPFYDRRTQGEELQWLGQGYKKNEVSRFDNFLDEYMGKDYHGTAYELCSMGFEYAYTKPEKLAQDPDMEAWILGMLAIC